MCCVALVQSAAARGRGPAGAGHLLHRAARRALRVPLAARRARRHPAAPLAARVRRAHNTRILQPTLLQSLQSLHFTDFRLQTALRSSHSYVYKRTIRTPTVSYSLQLVLFLCSSLALFSTRSAFLYSVRLRPTRTYLKSDVSTLNGRVSTFELSHSSDSRLHVQYDDWLNPFSIALEKLHILYLFTYYIKL